MKFNIHRKLLYALGLFIFWPNVSKAATVSPINTSDTAWMLVASVLVISMTPVGLGLFYGGMVRSKNILNTIGMSFLAFALTSIVWVVFGYSLAFAPNGSDFIGTFKYILLNNISINSAIYHIPVFLYCAFQLAFAGVTVALISGAVIERIKFSSWLILCVLWLIFVYVPIAHWVWGGGFLQKLGVLDFAGGSVVETNSGISALVLSLMVGKRKDFKKAIISPSSIALAVIGAGFLWVGWFGFNAGSAISANGLAAWAFLSTNTAAAAGALSWMSAEWYVQKHPTMLGAASGAIAGLVAITPACGFVNVGASIVIGAIGGILSWFGVTYLKHKFVYDDSLDVFGVHGLNGIWGLFATGLFATSKIGSANGLFYGNIRQIFVQLFAIFITIVYAGTMTFVVAKLTSFLTNGLRVDEEEEQKGLDIATHTEKGFDL